MEQSNNNNKEPDFSTKAPQTIEEWLNYEELPVTIWNNKYRHGEEDFEQWLDRVSGHNQKIKELIREQKFIFAGRILSNRGVTDRKITYSNCFIAGTKVLCTRGLVNIENIVVGDEVLSSDGKFHRVNETMHRRYQGDLYRFDSHALYNPIICTPNHKFLTNHGWKRADRIFPIGVRKEGEGIDKLKTAWLSKAEFAHAGEGLVIDFTEGYECDDQHRVCSSGNNKAHLEAYVNSSPDKEVEAYAWKSVGHDINQTATLSSDFLYFIGRWIGDGSITRRRGKRNHSILQIVFNANTESEAAARCAKIGEDVFGFAPYIRSTEQNVIAIRFESPLIASWFYRNFGEKCEGKRIPMQYLGNLDILCGILDADGCINTHGGVKIVLKNLSILQWIRDTCYLNGINAGQIKDISHRQTATGELRISVSQANAHLNSRLTKTYHDKRKDKVCHDRGDYIPLSDISVLEEQECDVYNLSVEGDHTYTVNGVVVHNCYVLSPPEDNLESIFEIGARLARTFSYGGGAGLDISNLRPKDAPVNNAAKSTSGTVSFMDFYSYITGLIGQSGRRGALMLSISCEHPDLIEFINLKSDLNVCTKANISIRVTDEFMRAVETDSDFRLHFTLEDGSEIEKIVKAREVFYLIAEQNWDMAEPGILYWDRISNYNLLQNTSFKYAGVNPCAEESLPAGGSCLLGSINLSEFVDKPFTSEARFLFPELCDAVELAVRGLNDVLMEGLPLHPLEEQRESVKAWRQIGLGTMGLGDMLVKLGIKYGSSESLTLIQNVYRTIALNAVRVSLSLAKEKGAFPNCTSEFKNAMVESDFIRNLGLTQEMLDDIRHYGLYNSQLLTCAPTGSIGTMLQVSTGVEPIYAISYTRRTVSLNNEETVYQVDAPIAEKYRKATGKNSLPDYFVSSMDVPYHERIKVQAMLQDYIDASISSTVNLPKETTIDEVADIYMQAWKNGLKGITVYRDGCKREAILSGNVNKEPEIQHTPIKKTSDDCIGRKRTLTTGCGSLHLTAFWDRQTGQLLETYFSKGSQGGCANFMVGLSRMVSLAARGNISIEDIVDQLKSSGTCPSYAVRKAVNHDTSIGSSCPVAIGYALMDMYHELQAELKVQKTSVTNKDKVVNKSSSNHNGLPCPNCGERLNMVEGCMTCPACGYSKCN